MSIKTFVYLCANKSIYLWQRKQSRQETSFKTTVTSTLGISKIARVVGYCAAKLQLQERLAREIVTMLNEALDGKQLGMAIVMKGTHLCKTMRGVKSQGQMTVSYLSGIYKDNAEARREFYKLIDLQDG